MNKYIAGIFSAALCSFTFITSAHTTSATDPLQEVDQFMRTQITNWSGQLNVAVPLQSPNSPLPDLTDLLAPLIYGAQQALNPIYNKLVAQVETRGFGTSMAEYANLIEKLDPKATENIKQAMDRITDPSERVTIIKLLTKMQYMREATLRANPKTQLILQDVFELAKQECGGYRTTFQDIVEMCESLDRMRAIKVARSVPVDNGWQAVFDNRTKKELMAAHPEAKLSDDAPSDYYVPSYYYIFGIVPRDHVVLLAIGLSWDSSMPGPERDLLKEQANTCMNDYLLMAKMNCWENTIIYYVKQAVGLTPQEEKLLSDKLDDVRFADPDPNNTLKARQDVMQTTFTAVRIVQNLSAMGIKHSNLFTYVLFMNGDALSFLYMFCTSMGNNLKLEKIQELWSKQPQPPKVRWFSWW